MSEFRVVLLGVDTNIQSTFETWEASVRGMLRTAVTDHALTCST